MLTNKTSRSWKASNSLSKRFRMRTRQITLLLDFIPYKVGNIYFSAILEGDRR